MDEVDPQVLYRRVMEMSIVYDSDIDEYSTQYIYSSILYHENVVFMFYVDFNIFFGLYYTSLMDDPWLFTTQGGRLQIIGRPEGCVLKWPGPSNSSGPFLSFLKGPYICERLDCYGNLCPHSFSKLLTDWGLDFEYFPDYPLHRLVIGAL